MWTGWIIEESLEDKNILSKLKVINSIIERNIAGDQVRTWRLYVVEIDDSNINAISKELEKQIKLGYYTHFTDFNNLLIIFKGKSFKIRLTERPKEEEHGAVKFKANPEDLKIWKDAVAYGTEKGKVDQRYIVNVE